MKLIKCHSISVVLVIFFTTLVMLSAAQETSPKIQAAPGMMKTKGVIVEHSPAGFTLRDEWGSELAVVVTDQTVIKEKKRNFFRKAIDYSPEQLLLGLKVQVEGHGDSSGALVAHEIKFTQDDLRVAQIISSRVSPVERRVQEAEDRQGRLEEDTQALSGNITELKEAFGIARGEAREAQKSAEQAQRTADQALSRVDITDERVTALDEYKETKILIIQFEFNSANLLEKVKLELDRLAHQTKNLRGFLIEVKGFASADGNDAYNVRLSESRAESVVRYLIESHQIPLRRIITPHGYGEMSPVAENSSIEGRKQNRRVEVRLLVNHGLTESTALEANS